MYPVIITQQYAHNHLLCYKFPDNAGCKTTRRKPETDFTVTSSHQFQLNCCGYSSIALARLQLFRAPVRLVIQFLRRRCLFECQRFTLSSPFATARQAAVIISSLSLTRRCNSASSSWLRQTSYHVRLIVAHRRQQLINVCFFEALSNNLIKQRTAAADNQKLRLLRSRTGVLVCASAARPASCYRQSRNVGHRSIRYTFYANIDQTLFNVIAIATSRRTRVKALPFSAPKRSLRCAAHTPAPGSLPVERRSDRDFLARHAST